jgi:hypothetical protein
MIKTFKTKQPVIVDTRNQISATVYLDIKEAVFNGLAYYGQTDYYYLVDGQRHLIEYLVPTFTVDEATAIEANFTVEGNTHTERYIDLIVKATKYQLDIGQYFGLSSADWEEYVAPVEEVVIDNALPVEEVVVDVL